MITNIHSHTQRYDFHSGWLAGRHTHRKCNKISHWNFEPEKKINRRLVGKLAQIWAGNYEMSPTLLLSIQLTASYLLSKFIIKFSTWLASLSFLLLYFLLSSFYSYSCLLVQLIAFVVYVHYCESSLFSNSQCVQFAGFGFQFRWRKTICN